MAAGYSGYQYSREMANKDSALMKKIKKFCTA
jgi:hypothetical protein